MYSGNTLLAIIPARGGSKGVIDKNIRPFAGASLLHYAIRVCKEAAIFDRIVVSTDSEQIAREAAGAGAEVPFLRSAELASDDAPVVDVILDLVCRMEVSGEVPDILMLVEPTCPLREAKHLSQSVDWLIRCGTDSVATVSPIPSQYHPGKSVTITSSGLLSFYSPEGATITSRQQLSSNLFYRNGASYAVWRKKLMETRTLYGKSCAALLVESPLVSIDTAEDFAWAEFVMNKRCSSASDRSAVGKSP